MSRLRDLRVLKEMKIWVCPGFYYKFPLSPRQIKELRGAPRSVKTVHSTKLRQQNLLGSNYISVLFVTPAHLELFYLNVNFNVSSFRDLFLRAISHFNTRILRHTTSAVVLTLWDRQASLGHSRVEWLLIRAFPGFSKR